LEPLQAIHLSWGSSSFVSLHPQRKLSCQTLVKAISPLIMWSTSPKPTYSLIALILWHGGFRSSRRSTTVEDQRGLARNAVAKCATHRA